MEQYIEKTALVAEIENKIKKYTKRGEESDARHDGYGMYWGGVLSCLNEIRTLCDTLETKDVQEPKDKERIREEIERLHEEYRGKKGDADVRRALRTVLFFIDSMQEKPKSTERKINMKKGIELIAEERQRQIDVEGYSAQHDSQHNASELIYAAIAYVESAKVGVNCAEMGNTNKHEIMRRKTEMGRYYPFGWNFKPTTDIRDLIKAGALIAAAIDRLQKDNDQQ